MTLASAALAPSTGSTGPAGSTGSIGSINPALARPRYRSPFVLGTVGYVHPDVERPVIHLFDTGRASDRDAVRYDLREVPIADGRHARERPRIHHEGYELWDAPSQVRDFDDAGQLESVYYRECVDLACRVTGAAHGVVFDHLLRQREAGRPPLTFGRVGDGRAPAAVGRVHNDYSQASGLRRLQLVLNDPELAAGVRRYSIVNLWRAISGPVLDTPLAVCEANSVQASDLVPAQIRYPQRVGEICLTRFSPRHRWAYFSAMDRHEVLVFKQFDSHPGAISRFTPHAAFDLPDIPPDAPLRRSVEVRCLVMYD